MARLRTVETSLPLHVSQHHFRTPLCISDVKEKADAKVWPHHQCDLAVRNSDEEPGHFVPVSSLVLFHLCCLPEQSAQKQLRSFAACISLVLLPAKSLLTQVDAQLPPVACLSSSQNAAVKERLLTWRRRFAAPLPVPLPPLMSLRCPYCY
jgi:hypothetical protein